MPNEADERRVAPVPAPVPGDSGAIDTGGGDDDPPDPQPLDRLRARLDARISGRPISAYAVLAAGALVLCVLLGIIFATSGNDGQGEARTCYQQPDVQIAKSAVLAGEVERVRVIVPEGQPAFGVALLELDYVDGTCYTLPQGVIGQDNAFLILGALESYNRTTDQRRVDVSWREESVPTNVLFTPTPFPTEAPAPTWTPAPTATVPAPTDAPTLSPAVASPPAGVEFGPAVPPITPMS